MSQETRRRQRAERPGEAGLQADRAGLRAARRAARRQGVRDRVEEDLQRGRDPAAAVGRLQHPRGAAGRHAAGRDLRADQDRGGPVRDEGRAPVPGRAASAGSAAERRCSEMPGKDAMPSTVERSDDDKAAADVGGDLRLGHRHLRRRRRPGPPHRVRRAQAHPREGRATTGSPRSRNGPVRRAGRSRPRRARPTVPTAGGVDANASKKHLLRRSRRQLDMLRPLVDDEGRARRGHPARRTTARPRSPAARSRPLVRRAACHPRAGQPRARSCGSTSSANWVEEPLLVVAGAVEHQVVEPGVDVGLDLGDAPRPGRRPRSSASPPARWAARRRGAPSPRPSRRCASARR